ncbi:hypothetical protein HMPREF3022_08870 [Neisseria sp. HMSC065C04]|uniref:restriction endonuclease subunit S n=1 Tax=Neisseria sp. HMSC065C04 TaxID=1739524 RepID=UPI0008A63C53|nr:restriction endonuclease subunit S [Neisseria sp. HMSC065C04]OFO67865.1 hypothetical protein HMPREF3022_08870 [Neisseria sp. HMSC065C04]
MNRYERYKDSGIPWLGEVPEHWEIKPLKFSINNISHKVESQLSNLRYFGLENIESFTGRLLLDIELESEGIANEFQENDVLFGKLRPYLAKVHLSRLNGLVSTEALVFRASNAVNPKFLFYFCVSSDFIDAVNGTTFGSKMPRASWDNIGNFRMLIPSLKEQTAIAHYLDTKLGEIDALIDKQQTLLEKLAEQRTAVITHAVTKGLNPAAPMKNSGVEWLGDVPAHWDIKHSNQIFKIHNGATPKTSEPDYWGDEIVWFTPKDLGDNQNKEISISLKMITKEGYENCGVSLAPAKSIALSKRAPIGHLAITLLPAVVNQGCFLLEVLAPNDVNYLYYWLYANKTTLNSFGQGSTFMELPREKFAMLKISIPPKNEQTSIADYLDQETAKIDRLRETVNQTIGRLKEYRTALITQAVTGKIKVTDE